MLVSGTTSERAWAERKMSPSSTELEETPISEDLRIPYCDGKLGSMLAEQEVARIEPLAYM